MMMNDLVKILTLIVSFIIIEINLINVVAYIYIPIYLYVYIFDDRDRVSDVHQILLVSFHRIENKRVRLYS